MAHSFRDPSGSVQRSGGRILRTIEPESLDAFQAFLASNFACQAVQRGNLPETRPIAGSPHLFEHQPVPFPSYPYEWPPEMLHAAGKLTLELAQAALPEGFRLKDATPYNVLFQGARPLFVDLLSFESRGPLDASWTAYGQLIRTFVLPLLASRHFGLTLQQILFDARDGLTPEACYRLTSPLQRLRPPFLSLVSLPKWLAGRAGDYRIKPAASAEQASYILEGLLRHAGKQLDSVAPPPTPESTWTGYLDHKSLYSPAQLAQKGRFVTEALEIAKPARVLDVGANEGHFSLLAARAGASVVAIDTDPAVVGSLWKKASQAGADVLPLVVDLTRPTPATGWRNQENLSFLDRAEGHFDLVSMLAVVHHILITERIPLQNLFELADVLSKQYLLVEFVGPEDPMFRNLLRGRDKLYSHISKQWFEAQAQARFETIRSERVNGLDRWLYLLQRRNAKS